MGTMTNAGVTGDKSIFLLHNVTPHTAAVDQKSWTYTSSSALIAFSNSAQLTTLPSLLLVSAANIVR